MADQVKWRTVLVGIGVVGVLGIGGVSIANAAGAFVRPEPAPTVVAEVVQVRDVEAEPEHPTPTPTPTVEPVVEAPPVEEAPVEEPPAESGPDLCPSGTQANQSDGYNDLTCFPDSCYVGPVSNESNPECITAMPPDYYR